MPPVSTVPAMPKGVDNQALAEALQLVQSLGTLNDDPNAQVSPEHMQLVAAAFQKAGLPPEAIFAPQSAAIAPQSAVLPQPAAIAPPPVAALPNKKKGGGKKKPKASPAAVAAAHRDEAKAAAFMQTLNNVLRPAFNDYDPKEAAQAQVDLMAERLQTTATSGAAQRSMRLRAAQVRRTLLALLKVHGLDGGLLDRHTTAADGNWLEALHQRLYASIPGAKRRSGIERALGRSVEAPADGSALA